MTTIETFIGEIAGEPQPMLGRMSGTLLFEVRDRDETQRWLVDIDKGVVGIRPAEPGDEADATVRGERKLLNDVAEGRANAMAAMLRGDISIEGSAELLVVFQRLFPGPNGRRSEQP
jgi:hypothetical protein